MLDRMDAADDKLQCKPKNTPKCFFDMQSTKPDDCDKMWSIVLSILYRNVNVICLTWIVSLPYLVKLSIHVLQVNSS